MFLVVEDQLRVSEGWVRCGRCANVFNAVDDLIDVEQGTPVQLDIDSLQAGARLTSAASASMEAGKGAAVPGQAMGSTPQPGGETWTLEPADGPSRPPAVTPTAGLPVAPSMPPVPPAPFEAPYETSFKVPTPTPGVADPARPATREPAPSSAPGARPPATGSSIERAAGAAPPGIQSSAAEDDSELPDRLLRSPSESFDDDSVAPSSIGVSQGWSTITPAEAPEGTPSRRKPRRSSLPPADAAPSFVREAERAQRWQRSPLRPALRVAAVVLALLAGLQGALLFRDQIAAQVPGLAPVLQAACAPFGCSVQPLRRIERLAVDSSGLTRVDDGSDPNQHRYRLAVLLHNKASTALMAPAIELTLTDAREEIVARRVLQLADFGQPPQAIAAGQEMPLRVLLATGPQAVVGYTVEIFYP